MLGYVVVQRYLKDVHLVPARDGHKLNLRLYVAIVCDPSGGRRRAYLHHRAGKCMYTARPYDRSSVDFEQQITSVELRPEVYRSLPLTLEELRLHWQTRGIRYDDVWRRIVAQMALVARAVLPHVCILRHCQHSVRFQLFGADVILDRDLHPYVLELNKGPNMKPVNARDRRLKQTVLEDTFALAGVTEPPSSRGTGYQLLAAA